MNLLLAKLIGAGVLTALLAGAVFHVRYTYGLVAEQEAQIAKLSDSVTQLNESITQFAAADAAQNKLMASYQERLNATKSNLDSAIKRLRTPVASNASVPAIAPAACGGNGKEITDILNRYGERFYQSAARADAITEQLTAAQELLQLRQATSN